MMAAAKSIGISLSEMDRYVDLVDVIFPFFEQNMEMSAGELWENVGKSKLVEILPVLKVLITGEQSTATVMGSVEALLNDARTTALASGEVVDDDQIRTQAIETLIQHAELLPNRQLRQHIRGERTPPIGFVRINHNGSSFLVGELDEPQMAMINRNFGTHVEITSWDPPEDGFVRQAEATRVPLFKYSTRSSAWVASCNSGGVSSIKDSQAGWQAAGQVLPGFYSSSPSSGSQPLSRARSTAIL